MAAKRGRADSDDDAAQSAPPAAAIAGALSAFGTWVTANASAAGTAIAAGTRHAATAISGAVAGGGASSDDLSPPHLPSGRLPTHATTKRGSGGEDEASEETAGKFAIGSGVDSDDDDADTRERVVAARGSAMAAKDLAVARRNAAELIAEEEKGSGKSSGGGGGVADVLGKAWESTRTGFALMGSRVADGARTVGGTVGPALSTAAKTVVDGTSHAATRAREAVSGTGGSGGDSGGGGSGILGSAAGGGGESRGSTFKMPSVALPSFAVMAAATRLKSFSGAAADIVP